jgi:hypothetical protein
VAGTSNGQQQQGGGAGQSGQSGKDKGKGQGQGKGNGKEAGKKPGGGSAVATLSNGNGDSPGGFGCGKHAALFETDPNAKYALDEVSFEEQTVRAFSELLTIKSTRVTRNEVALDTDNLTAYFTGDIDELFKEIKTERLKKSKILMLLDSSGSMQATDGMCDNKLKTHVLVGVCKRIQRILDDIRELEGVNVDYEVRAFDTRYYKLSKENWENEYLRKNGGGTDCAMGFMMAQDEILADVSIDGHKMVILVTDGQIDHHQVDMIKDRIIRHNADVKCMILGVGVDKHFEEKLGGRNIISSELADGEVLQAIEDMLE